MRNHGWLPQISQTSKTGCLRQPVPANANANCSLREIADAEMQAGGADMPIFGLCVPSPSRAAHTCRQEPSPRMRHPPMKLVGPPPALRPACANASEDRPRAFGPTPTEGLRPAGGRRAVASAEGGPLAARSPVSRRACSCP
jgi:hypothetical protein